MSHIIKSFKVEWSWSGDEYALLGFNVAITPDGSNPHEDVVALSKTGKENFYHIFRDIIVEKNTQYTAWVQALYEGKDSPWESVSGFVVDDDDKATITTKDQHEKIVNETINYRTTGAPDNNPSPTNIIINDNPNGTLDIELQWAKYSQGSLKADMIFLFWKKSEESITEPLSVNDNSEIFNVNTEAASRYTFEGVPPNKFYSFGLAAGRRTENGLEIGSIQNPAEWTNIDIGYAAINHDDINASAGNGAVQLTDQGLIGKKEDGTITLKIDSLGNAHFNGTLTVGDVPTDTNELETQTGAQEKATAAKDAAELYTSQQLTALSGNLSEDINNLGQTIEEMSLDTKVTRAEANVLEQRLNELKAEDDNLVIIASGLGLDTTVYMNAINALDTYLSSYINQPSYPIDIADRATMKTNFEAVQTEKTNLINAITNKRADNARDEAKTYANDTFQTEIPKRSAPPFSPSDGDLWIDTSPDPNILKRYESSSSSWIKLSPTTANDVGAEQLMTKRAWPPSSPNNGDLWIDTGEIPNTLKIYDGTEWVDSRIKDTSEINDGAGLGDSAQWSKVADDGGKPADNADITNYTDQRISNALTANDATMIARPGGAMYSSFGSTGALVITLPQSWTSTMMYFKVNVFSDYEGKSFTLHIGGKNDSSDLAWKNTTANLVGSTDSDNRVRFGHNGTKCCIVIGNEMENFGSAKVSVTDFLAGYYNYEIDKWNSGWEIDTKMDLTGYTFSKDYSDALIDAKNTKYIGSKTAEEVESSLEDGATAKSAVDNWTNDNTTYASISGNHVRTGKILSQNYSTGVTGSKIDLDNGIIDFGGKLKYDPDEGLIIDGDGSFTGDISGATGTFSGNISGGAIDIGDGKFTVDRFGNLIANDVNIAGEINVTGGNAATQDYADNHAKWIADNDAETTTITEAGWYTIAQIDYGAEAQGVFRLYKEGSEFLEFIIAIRTNELSHIDYQMTAYTNGASYNNQETRAFKNLRVRSHSDSFYNPSAVDIFIDPLHGGNFTVEVLGGKGLTLHNFTVPGDITGYVNRFFEIKKNKIITDGAGIKTMNADGDYSILTDSQLKFYKANEAIPYWYTKQVAFGTAADGDEISLNWENMPKVQTAIKKLTSYLPAYSSNKQIHNCFASGVTPEGFKVSAKTTVPGITNDYGSGYNPGWYMSGSSWSFGPINLTGATYFPWSPVNTNRIEYDFMVRIRSAENTYTIPWWPYEETAYEKVGTYTVKATIKYQNDTPTYYTHQSFESTKTFNTYNGRTNDWTNFINTKIVIDDLSNDKYKPYIVLEIVAEGEPHPIYPSPDLILAGFLEVKIGEVTYASEVTISQGEVLWIAVEGGQ